MTTAYRALHRHAAERPDALAFAEWRDGRLQTRCTYAELLTRTFSVAKALQDHGIEAGERVLLVLPNDLSFVHALVACTAAGVIAVPAPTPERTRTTAFQDRLARIVADCTPRAAIVPRDWSAKVSPLLGETLLLSWEDLAAASPAVPVPASTPVAFLQYTSGSTSAPRGVVVTHEAVAASCAQAAEAYRESTSDVAVTWVPLYHDMGLITAVMRPLLSGYLSVLMRPDDFIRSPRSWLEAVQHCRATLSSAPNFAYDLCVRKAVPDGLDLSSWRVARNASEVVSATTVEAFTKHFADAGFAPTAMCPSYGLAEATLTVTTSRPGEAPVVFVADAARLDAGFVRPGGNGTGRTLVSSGSPVTGARVRVEAREGTDVGEIHVSGPQMSPGYWTSGTRTTQHDWWPTGDLGFLHEGQIYVLGRTDDVLVLRGRKLFVADISAACRDVAGLRPGRLAAFSIPDTERVVLVSEVVPDQPDDQSWFVELAGRVTGAVARDLQVRLTDVGFVRAGQLPMTTSGKVRVRAIKHALLDGQMPLLHLSSNQN